MKRRKLNLPRVIEEIGFAKGTESMKASQMRPTSFKDKSKYSRKTKHKNHLKDNPGDFFYDVVDLGFFKKKPIPKT